MDSNHLKHISHMEKPQKKTWKKMLKNCHVFNVNTKTNIDPQYSWALGRAQRSKMLNNTAGWSNFWVSPGIPGVSRSYLASHLKVSDSCCESIDDHEQFIKINKNTHLSLSMRSESLLSSTNTAICTIILGCPYPIVVRNDRQNRISLGLSLRKDIYP